MMWQASVIATGSVSSGGGLELYSTAPVTKQRLLSRLRALLLTSVHFPGVRAPSINVRWRSADGRDGWRDGMGDLSLEVLTVSPECFVSS